MDTNMVINKFISDYFSDELKAICDDTFSYDSTLEIVTYTTQPTTEIDKLFLDFCKANGLAVNAPFFVMALLHEIGHYLTLDSVSDDEYIIRDLFMMSYEDSDESDTQKNMAYFSLPSEFIATATAIDFANSHPREIEKLVKDLAL